MRPGEMVFWYPHKRDSRPSGAGFKVSEVSRLERQVRMRAKVGEPAQRR
jgi:hypothetical protein